MRIPSVLTVLIALLLPPLGSAEPRLVWSDEFETPGPPDPKKWDYEVGFVRNKERQYYTRARLENARVENGCLVIEGRKEQWPNPRFEAGAKHWMRNRPHADYTAASLITKGKASWRDGRIEVRARVPQGRGMWPAIWMLGDNIKEIGWPRCGEIDIMEYVGKKPDTIYGTVHYAGADGKHKSKGGRIRAGAPHTDFHVYAIEWRADRIDFFFDDSLYHTVPVDIAGKGAENPFRKKHYLLINLAIGGSWGGPVDDSALPAKYLIDYVRIYELTEQ